MREDDRHPRVGGSVAIFGSGSPLEVFRHVSPLEEDRQVATSKTEPPKHENAIGVLAARDVMDRPPFRNGLSHVVGAVEGQYVFIRPVLPGANIHGVPGTGFGPSESPVCRQEQDEVITYAASRVSAGCPLFDEVLVQSNSLATAPILPARLLASDYRQCVKTQYPTGHRP